MFSELRYAEICVAFATHFSVNRNIDLQLFLFNSFYYSGFAILCYACVLIIDELFVSCHFC